MALPFEFLVFCFLLTPGSLLAFSFLLVISFLLLFHETVYFPKETQQVI
jgi:hypothetical protein